MRKNENKYDGVNLMTALFRFYFFVLKGKSLNCIPYRLIVTLLVTLIVTKFSPKL